LKETPVNMPNRTLPISILLAALTVAGCGPAKHPAAAGTELPAPSTPNPTATGSTAVAGASTPGGSALLGAPATVTDNGFQYRVQAGPASLVPQYDRSGKPSIASPGSDFVAIPIVVTNLQTDRAAPIVGNFSLFVAKSAADTFGTVERTDHSSTAIAGGPALSNIGATIDCSDEPVTPFGAAAPPAGDCIVNWDRYPDGYVFLPDGTPLEYATALNEGAIAAGGTANLTIYTEAVAATASLSALALYVGTSPLPLA
jgi:hypothetical protein